MLCGNTFATDRLVDDAKKAPAIPATDRTLLGRLTFKLRFARGIAEFLLATLSSNKCVTSRPTASVAHFARVAQHYGTGGAQHSAHLTGTRLPLVRHGSVVLGSGNTSWRFARMMSTRRCLPRLTAEDLISIGGNLGWALHGIARDPLGLAKPSSVDRARGSSKAGIFGWPMR
jgi:hypothetical protein